MARPTLLVEVAFTTDPTDPSPVYTDITSKVLGFTIRRGRQYELDTIQASTLDLRLDNGDRRFDPTYTHSPYYPYVLPNRKVRVSATWSGTTYRLFTGFVESWPLTWEAPRWGSVSMRAVDGFVALQNAQLTATANLFANGGFEADTSGWTVTNGTLTRVTTGQLNGVACGKLNANAAVSPTRLYPGGSSGLQCGTAVGNWYRVSAWIWIPSGLGITASNFAILAHTDTISGGGTTGSGQPLDTWVLHDFAFPVATDSANAYIEFQLAETGAAKYVLIDGFQVTLTESLGDPGQTAVFAFSTRPPADGNAAKTGLRVDRCLTTAGWNSADRLLDQGAQTVQAVEIPASDQQQVLAHIQDIAQAEPGIFFLNGAGQAVFHDRMHRLTGTPRCTFVDATFTTSASTIQYTDLQPDIDITRVVNDANITATGSVAQNVEDATSQTKYFRRSLNLDIPVEIDADAKQRAGWEIYLHKDPALRFNQLTLQPQADSNAWPWALSLELSDRVNVKRAPSSVSTIAAETITKKCFVEAVEHSVSPDVWETSFQLSPADLYDNFGVIGTSALGTGVLAL